MTARSPMVDVVTSPGGIQAWHVPNGSGVLSLRITFDGAGTLQSPPEQPSLAWLDALTFAIDGCGPLTAQEMLRRREENLIILAMGVDALATTVSLQSIGAFRDEAFELLAHALCRPHYEADVIARIRAQAVSSIEWDARQPEVAGSLALSRLLFGPHPFSRSGAGTTASVEATTTDELRAYRRRAFARENMRVTAVGAISASELGQALDLTFGDLPAQAHLEPEPPITPQPPGVEHITRDLDQCLVYLARQTERLSLRENVAEVVLWRILNDANTGRLYRELRERRGLVYWSSVNVAEDRLVTTYRASLATGPETVAEAIATVRATLSSIAETGPTDDEMATVNEAAEGTFLHGIDTTNQLADYLASLQYFGRPADAIDNRVADIRSVTADEVRAVAARLLGPGDFSIVTVGRRV